MFKKRKASSGSWRRALLLGAAVGVLAAAGSFAGLFGTWSARVTDRLFLPVRVRPEIRIVAIDDASLSSLGRWPWSREVHATLIRRLTEAGARVIAYDVNFPEASEASADASLMEAVRAAGDVVLPLELTFLPGSTRFDPEKTIAPISLLAGAAAATGFSNIPLDDDSVARRTPLEAVAPDGSTVRSFGWEALRLAGTTPDLTLIPQDRGGRMAIWFPGEPRKSFPTLSAVSVVQGTADLTSLRNAVVFVGATARDLHDEQTVATSRGVPMSGVEIHASVYDTLASRRFLVPLSPWASAGLLILLGLLLGLCIPRLGPRNGFVLTLIAGFAWVVGAFLFFDHGIVVDLVWPELLLVFGYAILVVERWAETEAERRRVRHAFGRYLSPSVVEELLRDPKKLSLGGERRTMSVLFSDLRGFTSLSEGLPPEQLVEVLNHYLDAMTRIVFEEGGVLDKYIGDAVMAFWNAPLDQADHALRATRAAVRMRDTLKEQNKAGVFPYGVELKVGIGVNTGEMVVGNIGAEMRYDYTVIGDSVNLASRTEGLCKEYGVNIIVTESTAKALGETFVLRRLDRVAVKGKKEPIEIFEVMGERAKASEAEQKLAEDFAAALSSYFAQGFTAAKERCEKILSVWPDDVATQRLKEKAEAFLKTPPPSGWDGTFVMTKK
jgi:adenylate cyclase